MSNHPLLALVLALTAFVGLFAPEWIMPLTLTLRAVCAAIMMITAVGMSNSELTPMPRVGLVMMAVGTVFIGTGILDPASPLDHLGQLVGVVGCALFFVPVFGPPAWFWMASHFWRR